MLALAVLIGAALAGMWLRDSLWVLGMLVRPNVLVGLLVAVFVVFVLHLHCVVDAYRLARRRRVRVGRSRGHASARALAISTLACALAVPYATAAYYDFRSYDLLVSVFADEEPVDYEPPPQEPAAAPAETGEPAQGSETEPRDEGGSAAPGSETKPAHQVDPPERGAYWKERGRVNLLLLGGDAGYDRSGIRTDTMIVVSLNARDGTGAIFGVPRNLMRVPLPPSARTELETFPDILNALWQYATWHPELFPGAKNPGATAIKETIGNLLGLEIDYYALVDLRGFVEMIDAVGGVTVNVRSHVYDAGVSTPFPGEEWILVDLEPGEHHLDGRLALGYVRTRWATSDYDRMSRQRCLVGALADQATPAKLLRRFPKLASTIKEYMQTDVPLKALPDLIELLPELRTERFVVVSFVPPAFTATWENGTPVPDVELIRRTVKEALRAKPKLGEETGLATLKGACG
ncbi:MAG: LCP family protein [Thermoleophilia bacterium]|nr:LCP family protein [Thermoleophilia bacterium]